MSIPLVRVVLCAVVGIAIVSNAMAQRVLLTPVNLRCEYHVNPLGIDATAPRLSWELRANDSDARDQKQVAYEVLVGSQQSLREGRPDMWDSGKIMSDATNQIVYEGKPLRSGQLVYWRVKVWNEIAEGPASDTAYWSMGLLQPSDWQAKWIGYDAPDPRGDPRNEKARDAKKPLLPPVPYLRSTFTVEKKVRRATAYATALGLYELHLNGQRVGDHYLTPGWTDFHKRVYYNTYDVTKLIQPGRNAIASPLADGWYEGYLGYSFKRHNYSGNKRLRVQLEIEYADGSKQIFGTDENWKASYGPLREADLLMGCTYDAKREMSGWDTTAFDDSAWQPALTEEKNVLVQAHPGNPVEIDRTFSPIKITEPKKGVYVFDLGQNMVGWAKFKFRPTPGKAIVVRYSEMLNPDGTPYTVALRSARATDTYWPNSSEPVTWEPQFTFHGFRYVEISGLDYKPGKDAVTGIVMHSKLEQSGEIVTSNKLVNQLFHNIIWGQKGNYLEVPTDCPQRDERLGWTGDAQFFVRTGSYNMDVSAFFTKWLVDLVEDSQMTNGGYTHVAPALVYTDGGATAWQDAAPICTWTMYRFYGDTRIIESHWPSLTRYMAYLHKTSKDLMRDDKPFGDWLNLNCPTKPEVIGTAYYAYVSGLMSEMAHAIGKEDQAKEYADLHDRIREKFISEFVLPDGSIKQSSQTGYALAFSMNLIPDDKKELAAKHFVDEIAKKNWHLATGFIGTPRLLPSLTNAGESDVAYRLLLTDTFPSWLYPVRVGATTMWERWDGWRPDVGFQNPGMNSFNHYAFGSVGQWMYESMTGIQTDGPGFRKIIIKPVPSPKLTFASGKYRSINGEIESSWKIEKGKLTMKVTIPINTIATVYVPSNDVGSVKEASGVASNQSDGAYAVYELGSGSYMFTGKF